ncbi:hypothetical protein KIN20_033553 [Parelaphostrongylus tenuis]|uniref:Uncharacterized protein n=1 Tax=Parelaphostrongylus tenuis TaxID=148309 RepID=A0AAD5R8B8_PARTN|nr:hypothetical protein KIN20_033553 [Parelaphostrongylus tenuis]
MAIDVVQPIAGGSGAWKFAGHTGYITSGGAFEKKRRGRPRANTRPATALPMELHQSVSVFVDIDSPEEKLKPTIISESSSVSRGSTASVPPVHIEVPENEKVEAEESQGTSTLAQQQASSHEGTQRKHVNKRKDRTNVNNPAKVPTNLRVSKSSGEADSDVCSQSSVTVEEQQLETVTGFLASCLRERRKEQQLKQQNKNWIHLRLDRSRILKWSPSPTRLCRVTKLLFEDRRCRTFRAKYEQFRKRRLLQHQRVRVDSNVNVKETAEKCVENGENNIASTFNRPGFKPVKPMSASEKSEFISFVENVIRERLKKKRLSRSNVAKTAPC